MIAKHKNLQARRRRRLRYQLRLKSKGRARLSVFRSSKNIYAQVIDDQKGVTLASASTIDKSLKSSIKSGSTVESASKVGKLVAERASKAGVSKIVFDKGSYLYHGRVKALADAARENGLSF